MDQNRLTHLRQLEAESIHIIREVAAEFSNPVMMYSIGKDSSVMLHLARKAFFPGTLPFPLLHVDTGWKFREMYEFRDRTVKNMGAELLIAFIAGIPKISVLSCGITTTARSTRAKAFAYFRSLTGPNSISGNTSSWKTSKSYRSTWPRRARYWSATAC